MVLSHEQEGNLRDYLQENHSELTLRDRIAILKDLCESLCCIHEKDLIHCDLHSGNILIEGNGCLIADLGLCGPVDDENIWNCIVYCTRSSSRKKEHKRIGCL